MPEDIPGQIKRQSSRRRIQRAMPITPDTRCTTCGVTAKYARMTRQHKDGNPYNNDPSNIKFLCFECHSQEDTDAGRWGNSF